MYLQKYSTPSNLVDSTVAKLTKAEPSVIIPAKMERIWINVHSAGPGNVDVCLGADEAVVDTLLPGQKTCISVPVYLGAVTVKLTATVGVSATVTVTELVHA